MNTDLNNEEYPRLTPPDVVYGHKDALKKKAVVIPLYAKVVAVAAAVALLFGIFWFRNALPEQELLAELKPVEGRVVSNRTEALAESQAHFMVPNVKPTAKSTVKPSSVPSQNTYTRVEMPLLAELQPKSTPELTKMDYPSNLLITDTYYAALDLMVPDRSEEQDPDELSLVGRGIYKMTEGQYDSFAAMFSGGLKSVKIELASIETNVQSSRSQLRQRVR